MTDEEVAKEIVEHLRTINALPEKQIYHITKALTLARSEEREKMVGSKAILRIVEVAVAQEREQHSKEITRFKKFCDWLFQEVFEGSPDGCDIQDKACEMGLLEERKVNPNENEYGSDTTYFAYWSKQDD